MRKSDFLDLFFDAGDDDFEQVSASGNALAPWKVCA